MAEPGCESVVSRGNYTVALLPEGQVRVSFKHLLDRAQPTAKKVYCMCE